MLWRFGPSIAIYSIEPASVAKEKHADKEDEAICG
jgi:hypothetical protein